MKSLFLRLRPAPSCHAPATPPPPPAESGLDAFDRLLPLAMGNAPHPFQACLLLQLMQQRQQR